MVVVGWLKILVTAQVLGFGIWIGLWPRACQFKYFNAYQQTNDDKIMFTTENYQKEKVNSRPKLYSF